MTRVVAALLGLSLLLPASVGAADLRGRVAKIVDGDTAVFVVAKRTRTLSLLGVNAPGAGRCFGRESAHALRKMLPRGAAVRLRVSGRRAEVKQGTTEINLTMVGSGYARAAPAPGSFGTRIRAAESIAKASGRGLWGVC